MHGRGGLSLVLVGCLVVSSCMLMLMLILGHNFQNVEYIKKYLWLKKKSRIYDGILEVLFNGKFLR